MFLHIDYLWVRKGVINEFKRQSYKKQSSKKERLEVQFLFMEVHILIFVRKRSTAFSPVSKDTFPKMMKMLLMQSY